jgi:hypothetical protein
MTDAVPMIESLAQLANHEVPASVDANLKHLRSILVFGDENGDLQNIVVSVVTS